MYDAFREDVEFDRTLNQLLRFMVKKHPRIKFQLEPIFSATR